MKAKKINFDKLSIEQIILEARYSHGFLYWDNCGKVWNTICDKWPSFESIKVDPEQAIFAIRDEALEMNFNSNLISIKQNYPTSSLKLFKEVTKEAIPIIANTFQISSFTRVGNRIIYVYQTKDIEEATDIVQSTGLLNIKIDRMKPFGDSLAEPQVRFIIQNEDVGYQIRMSALSRTLNINIPKPLKVDSSDYFQNVVVIDVDYFTRKTVDLSMMDFEDLIGVVQKNLKYNLIKLLWQE